jgi:RNA polymerase sigma factor (TIGR02999 family)
VADLTLFLEAMQRGEPDAANALLHQVYAELRGLAARKMAREQPGHTLQPTALVHEAWLRLGDQSFENRAHFFGAAAEAMRRILVESARRKLAARRGGREALLDVDAIEITAPAPEDELLAVHEALDRLAAHHAEKAELVKLRYFAGLSIAEAALALGISERTAKRHWTYARAWLLDAMQAGG